MPMHNIVVLLNLETSGRSYNYLFLWKIVTVIVECFIFCSLGSNLIGEVGSEALSAIAKLTGAMIE